MQKKTLAWKREVFFTREIGWQSLIWGSVLHERDRLAVTDLGNVYGSASLRGVLIGGFPRSSLNDL